MQRIDHPDAAIANAQALHDLENGANGLTLVFAGAHGAHGFGLDPSPEAIEQVLDGVFIDAGIAIELQVGPQSRMAASHIADIIKRKGVAPAACDIRFGLDPIGGLRGLGIQPLCLGRDRARGRRRDQGPRGDRISRARSRLPMDG